MLLTKKLALSTGIADSVRIHTETSLILRAVADIRSKHSPCPRLGPFRKSATPLLSLTIYSPAVFKPYIHRSETAHLAEDHLLASLGGNRLSQKLANFTRIEMVDKAPDAGLSETGQALHKVEPLTDGIIWVVVDALLGCSLAKHICQEGRVSGFLIGHEFNEGHVLSIEASLEEFGFGEAGEAVMEEVELDPFL